MPKTPSPKSVVKVRSRFGLSAGPVSNGRPRARYVPPSEASEDWSLNDSGVGGAHRNDFDNLKTIEEATRIIVDLNAGDRLIEGSHAWREEQRVKAAIEKARKAKDRRKARNPYQF